MTLILAVSQTSESPKVGCGWKSHERVMTPCGMGMGNTPACLKVAPSPKESVTHGHDTVGKQRCGGERREERREKRLD